MLMELAVQGPAEWFALIVAAGAVVGWMLYTASKRKQIARSRQLLGQKLGLRTRKSRDRITMEGAYRGIEVDVALTIQRSGRTETELTQVSAGLPESLGLGLNVTRRTLVGRLGSVLKDTTRLGHRAFDESFITSARNGRKARRRLPDGLLQGMLRFVQRHGHLDLDDDGFRFETTGWIKENRKLVGILNELVELVAHLFPDAVQERKARRAARKDASKPARKLARQSTGPKARRSTASRRSTAPRRKRSAPVKARR